MENAVELIKLTKSLKKEKVLKGITHCFEKRENSWDYGI